MKVIGGERATECLKEVVWVESDEVEIADVNFMGCNGNRGCLRQSGRLKGSNRFL